MSGSYNWPPTELHQVCWILGRIHSNELHCALPESSSMWSLFAICPFLHLHKCACNVIQIWFLAWSCRVNIYEPAVWFTVSLLSVVSRVVWPFIPILTAISNWKSLNASLLKVMISSKNEHVFIRDLRDLTLQIIPNAWWASMKEGLMRPIGWIHCRHAPSWRFYWNCRIEVTGSPSIICIVCHQVHRHPSDQESSSIRNHLLAKAHITKLN